MVELGIVYGLATILFWGIADALASVPAKRMSPIAITLAIDVFIFVVFGLGALMLWDQYLWNQTTLIAAMSGVAGYFGFLMFIASLQRGTVGVSAAIANTYPVLVALFAVTVLKESLSLFELFGIGVTILGVVLLSTKCSLADFAVSDKRSVALALGAMLGWSVQIIIADYTVDTLTSYQVTHIGVTATLVIGTLLFFVTGQSMKTFITSKRSDLLICSVLGVLYFLGMLAIYTAFQSEKLSTFSAIAGAGPLVAAVFAHLFLHERLAKVEWLAVCVIVSGLALLGVQS